ncbi:MAG: FAD-binding protein, partial [Pseudonocardia sp.]|nr:FAD-binding protein [Pseudonocardia sp.]
AVFDAGAGGRLARTREGGHSAFRVVHAGGDATGAEIERALATAASDRSLPLLTGHVAVDALRDDAGAVTGLAVLDDHARPGVLRAPAVLLASGGFGHLYSSTTNPDTATGDGIALALRAGATAADLEFVQFHPTVLFDGPATGRRPLVTEAVRGEGAVLLDRAGRRFMTVVHPLADLAPRDVVAAAITRTLAATGADCVHLDARALDGFARRFPTVYAACAAAGIDPVREPIPVTPAAHYTCGGVVTDLDGRTVVHGLYAAGEVARTGLHGANRLASNSLLEGLVMGSRAARAVAIDRARNHRGPAVLAPSPAVPIAPRAVVQRAMTAAAGIGRDGAGLAGASDAVESRTTVAVPVDRAGVEDAALTLLAQAVLAAAGTRTESRGCHVRTDFPERDDAGRPVVRATAVAGAA